MKTKTLTALLLTTALSSTHAQTLSDNGIKVGVLTDLSGVYSELSGQGSVKAAQMAADDFMKANKAYAGKVSVIGVDHQNKADVASNKAS